MCDLIAVHHYHFIETRKYFTYLLNIGIPGLAYILTFSR